MSERGKMSKGFEKQLTDLQLYTILVVFKERLWKSTNRLLRDLSVSNAHMRLSIILIWSLQNQALVANAMEQTFKRKGVSYERRTFILPPPVN